MTLGIIKSACALAVVLWAAALSHAQQPLPQAPPTATIMGTVLDITGGTVPNATVVSQGPNENRTVVTGDNGFFKFDGINAGTPIRILVTASGFKSWTSNQIIPQSGQSFILTGVTLAVAPVEISVSAVTPEQIAAEQVKEDVTATGVTLGSLDYMSPEQVKAEPTDARSDLYSVGVSLYEMVTGQRMFSSTSSYSVMEAQVKQMPRPPIELQSSLPKALNDIIMVAIAKDPGARFQSAEAFRNALSGANVSVVAATAGATPVQQQTPVLTPLPVARPAPPTLP